MIWGGAVDFAPADDKLINIEHPMHLDPIGQLIASVLAKKKVVGATHLLIDIPYGKGAKLESFDKAEKFKEMFIKIGTKLNMNTKVVLTDGTYPIGKGIGPSLEARDVLKVLRNDHDAPIDLKVKSLKMSAEMLSLIENISFNEAKDIVEKILLTGKAYEKMKSIIKAQGGHIITPEDVPIAEFKYDIKSKKTGFIREISNNKLSFICSILGCPNNKKSGVDLQISPKQKVKRGEVLYTLHSESKESLDETILFLKNKEHDFIKIK